MVNSRWSDYLTALLPTQAFSSSLSVLIFGGKWSVGPMSKSFTKLFQPWDKVRPPQVRQNSIISLFNNAILIWYIAMNLRNASVSQWIPKIIFMKNTFCKIHENCYPQKGALWYTKKFCINYICVVCRVQCPVCTVTAGVVSPEQGVLLTFSRCIMGTRVADGWTFVKTYNCVDCGYPGQCILHFQVFLISSWINN